MNIAICDDELFCAQQIKQLTERFCTQKNLEVNIFLFDNATNFLKSNLLIYDIIFLDVLMKDYDGIQTAVQLRKVNSSALLIFVSAHLEYAPLGFEVKAFRYLLKQDLAQSFNICMASALTELKQIARAINIKTTENEKIAFKIRDILFFEALNHNVFVNTTRGIYKIYSSLTDLEKQLPAHFFLRVHKSYMVNMKNVVSIKGNNVCLADGQQVMCSRSMSKTALKRYIEIQGE